MESIRNCCRAAYTYPVSRERLMVVGGGILCTFLVGIIIVVLCSGGDESIEVRSGRDALRFSPLIVGHNDLAQNLKALSNNHLKDFNFVDITTNEVWSKCAKCRTDLTRLKIGFVSSQVWTVTSPCNSTFKDSVSLVLEQIDVIRRLIDTNWKDISLAKDTSEINQAFSDKKLSALIAVSGGHAIDSRLAVLRTYFNLGVRILGLGNDCINEQKIPWYNGIGLNKFGKKVVAEMNRLGMVIDVSKLPASVQADVIAVSETPVIIGNANAFELCNSIDNVRNEVLTKLKETNKGMVMVSFNPDLILPSTTDGVKNVTIINLINQINYLRDKVGAENIGIGGGFDGFEKKVFQLEDPSGIPFLFDDLFQGSTDQPQWSLEELQGLAGNNFLRILSNVEKKAQEKKENSVNPYDDYEPKEELVYQTCYSDFDRRYPPKS